MSKIPFSTLQQRLTQAIQFPQQGSLEDLGILSQAPLSIEKRLSIYQYAYQSRIHQGLKDDFPEVVKILGNSLSKKLFSEYLESNPSRYWTLAEIGAQLHLFISKTTWNHVYPFLSDLSHWEWIRVLSGSAPDSESFDFTVISKMNPIERLNLILELAPSVMLFETTWGIYPISESKESAQEILKKEMKLLVFQKDGQETVQVLSPVQHELIQRIKKGLTIGQLFQTELEVSEDQIGQWFSEWVTSRVIASVTLN